MSELPGPLTRPPHHANLSGTSFQNPWPSASTPTWAELLEYSFPLSWYTPTLHHHSHARDVKVVQPDWGATSLKDRGLEDCRSKCLVGTWLGHSGALVEYPSLPPPSTPSPSGTAALAESLGKSTYLLFDPIFSNRAGPTQYIGPARLKESPCQVPDLPGCEMVFISHNHYDHLDLSTVTAIAERFPRATWFVPLGNKGWIVATGLEEERVVEMDWWEKWEGDSGGTVKAASGQANDDGVVFKVSCVPAQHNSGRSGWDQGKTLWCGWVVERFIGSKDDNVEAKKTRKGAVYHAGDTGYRRTTKSEVTCPCFKEIGEKFGPFDMSFVPIWRGGTLGFISSVGLRLSHHDMPSAMHCCPTDAVAIHRDVRSRNTIGIHFGTFAGSEKETYEALIEFCEARSELGVQELHDQEIGETGRAGILEIGGSFAVEII